MPIPYNVKSKDLIGKHVTLGETVQTRICKAVVPKGTELEVRHVSKGFTLASPEPCPCCGISIQVPSVSRRQAFLADDEDAPSLESAALWLSRKDKGDHLWAECSNCGFRIENYKAAVLGHSSDDYVRPHYKHCPMCGKRMGVKDQSGKVVMG